MIIWDETMSTGLPDIDAQHKEIVGKFNQLSESLGGQKALETTGEILDFLQFYAVWHFEREENCMTIYQCPVAEQNKQAHAEFIAKFNRFYEQWQESAMTPELAQRTFSELESWIENHIRGIDVQLRSCVQSE